MDSVFLFPFSYPFSFLCFVSVPLSSLFCIPLRVLPLYPPAQAFFVCTFALVPPFSLVNAVSLMSFSFIDHPLPLSQALFFQLSRQRDGPLQVPIFLSSGSTLDPQIFHSRFEISIGRYAFLIDRLIEEAICFSDPYFAFYGTPIIPP